MAYILSLLRLDETSLPKKEKNEAAKKEIARNQWNLAIWTMGHVFAGTNIELFIEKAHASHLFHDYEHGGFFYKRCANMNNEPFDSLRMKIKLDASMLL